MITKERLEELIKEGAVIYDIFRGDIYPVNLLSLIKYGDIGFEYHNDYYHCDICRTLSDFYETREEAEWEQEFGRIIRTERLELPTWEEFLELNRHCIEFHFITKEGDINYIVISDMYMHNDMLKPKDEWTIIIKDFDDEYIFEKPATKTNYTLACRKAKELFLGEKK